MRVHKDLYNKQMFASGEKIGPAGLSKINMDVTVYVRSPSIVRRPSMQGLVNFVLEFDSYPWLEATL